MAELEHLQRMRFAQIIDNLYSKVCSSQIAHQFMLFLFNHEIYYSMILQFLIQENEVYMMSFIVLNWKKEQSQILESRFGRGYIQQIPLVYLCQRIKVSNQILGHGELGPIYEESEDEISDELPDGKKTSDQN